ncbi:MAG: Calx-beta domain-containing protein [Gammaproteobacteria bacterium]
MTSYSLLLCSRWLWSGWLCSRGLLCLAVLLCASGIARADGVIQFGDIRLAIEEGNVGYVTVVRSGSTVGAVSVLLNVGVGGTARFGTDFDIDLPLGVVQIPDGELSSSVKVTALNDSDIEGTEYATLSLSSASGATLGSANNLALDILDADSAPITLSFESSATLRIDEGEEQVLAITRSGDDGVAEINTTGQPGTATLGVDYADVTQTVPFDAVQQSADFSIFALNDNLFEGTETFTLVLYDGKPEQVAVPGGLTRLVLIEDSEPNQPGEFSLEVNGGSTVPEDVGSVSFRVTRDRGDSGAVTVSYVTADGTGDNPAVAGEDYTAATSVLNFANQQTEATFSISILDDNQGGASQRKFSVYIVNPTGLSNLNPDASGVTITIEEDDGNDNDDCPFLCGDNCFIATAAFGSGMDPHVADLRVFRDQGLMRILPGRMFVAAYYTLSPPMARIIARHESLRSVARGLLWPLVTAVGYPGTSLAGLMLLVSGLVWRRRRLSSA